MIDIRSLADSLIKDANSLSVDYADIRINDIESTDFTLQDKDFEGLMVGRNLGIGARVIVKGKIGFYSTNKEDEKNIILNAVKLAKANPSKELVKLAPADVIKDETSVPAKKPIQDFSINDKISLVKDAISASKIDDRIKSTSASYFDAKYKSLFYNTEGTEIVRNYSRCGAVTQIIAKQNADLEETHVVKTGYSFDKLADLSKEVNKSCKLLLKLLKARKPKAGNFRVLLDPTSSSIFVHEAVGHACEADAVLRDDSVLKGFVDKKIGSDHVSIFDNPEVHWENGYYSYDDEGVPAQDTELIVNGILKGYLHSRSTAGEMGIKSTGNCRAQGCSYLPLVRMSDTYMKSGDFSKDELIRKVKNGYLLIGSMGGEVDTKQGNFTFSSEHGYEIKNGKLGALVKGCNFGGRTLETLKNVSGVGKKMEFKPGMCGKGNQWVRVSEGANYTAIDKITIGGE